MKKIGRNDPCICGSGRKYKYCCKGFEPRNRNPHNPSELINPEGMEKLKGWMNVVSAQEEALRCFCKDNGFYYFKAMSIAENFNIYDKLSINALTKDDFFVCYKKQTTHEYVVRMFQTAVRQSEAFKKRETILNSAVKSHFDGAYELSIPTFFIIIEGVLRDIGGLDLKQKFKPTMTNEGLEEKVLYTESDSIKYFNAFVANLFVGSQEEKTFNRNTILHGANNSCFNEDNSLTLLLTLLEIQNYIFLDKSYPLKFKMENGLATLYHPNT